MKVLWSVTVLVLLAVAAIPAAAEDQVNRVEGVASPSRITFQVAGRQCSQQCHNERICRNYAEQACNRQRYCQPRQSCSQYRVGNQIIQKCRSFCQWLYRLVCRPIMRQRCMNERRCTWVCIAPRG
jgi:hypothetical protein